MRASGMIARLSALMGALAVGTVLASFFPQWPQQIRTVVGVSSAPSAQRAKSGLEAKDDQQGAARPSDDEIKSSLIESAAVQPGGG